MYIFIDSPLPSNVMSQLRYLGEARKYIGTSDEFGSLFWLDDLEEFRRTTPSIFQDRIILTPIKLLSRGEPIHALQMQLPGYLFANDRKLRLIKQETN